MATKRDGRELVTMWWPPLVKERVREKVGSKGMTAWVLALVEAALEELPSSPPSSRQSSPQPTVPSEKKTDPQKPRADPAGTEKPHIFKGSPAGRCETCGVVFRSHP